MTNQDKGFIEQLRDILPNIVTGETYPVEAWLFKKREGGDKLIKDQAMRITTDNKQQKYRLNREDVDTQAVDYDRIYNADLSDTQQDVIFVYSPNKGQYIPFTVEELNKEDAEHIAKFGTEEADWENFRTVAAMNERQNWKEQGNFWTEYRDEIALATLGFFVFLSLIGFGWGMHKIMGEVSKMSSNFASAAQAFKQAAQATGG